MNRRLLPALAVLLIVTPRVATASVTVLAPPTGEKAYQIAAEAFAELWQKVTGQAAVLRMADGGRRDLPEGPVVLIGSDAVQPAVHQLVRTGVIDGLGLQYGADNYRLLSLQRDGRAVLIVAGGSGRSTLYAAYDFFRRRAGAEYFWDGDVVPRRAAIDLAGLDVLEKPRFEYRGLRYFAHRGLHRFQAEHWDLDDWKREIDWLVKKRFNVFMLRTGIDDLFQRAFPGEVDHPPDDAADPDAIDRSHYDRTSFWPLKYRGELRKAVLQYARDRGLVHPEDTGTLTHWYSHTPSSFYRSHPEFAVMADHKRNYKPSIHGVWDIEREATWDAYWRLTATHIREYGGGRPLLFHTIGLAERTFGADDRENLQLKLYAYRKIEQKLREHYPDAPLMIGSWDFGGWWKDADVSRLLDEFDPAKTIILEYTADNADKVPYRAWGLPGRFPWIFGIFHGFARNSDVHEDYGILAPRLAEAAADPQCRGLVLWSEISHNDTFLLEYLADNSWQPRALELPKAVDRYCRTRYPAALRAAMHPLWNDFLTVSQSLHWTQGRNDSRAISFAQPQFRMLFSSLLTSPQHAPALEAECRRAGPALRPAPAVLRRLSSLAQEWSQDPLWLRDALDMSRTVAERALFLSAARGALAMGAWRQEKAGPEPIRRMARMNQDLLAAMADVVAQSDDFSMAASLRRLRSAQELGGVHAKINAHSEQTLKSNGETSYNRSHHHELVRAIYEPEAQAFWSSLLARVAAGDRRPFRPSADLTAKAKQIQDRFYATPLAEIAPPGPRNAEALAAALGRLEALVQTLLTETTP